MILLLQEPEDAARHQEHDRETDRYDAANALEQPITVEDRPRHQIVRGRWYFCCRSPRTPRGIRSTTATPAATPPPTRLTSPSPLRTGRVIRLSAAGGTSAAGARGRRAASGVPPRR